MASLAQVRAYREDMFRRSMALIATKGADYNRQQQLGGDTLFNLRVAAVLGIVKTPAQGILVRLTDKFMRLISLCGQPGQVPAVQTETVADTILDIHNYVDYLGIVVAEAREEANGSVGTSPAGAHTDGTGVAERVREWVDRAFYGISGSTTQNVRPTDPVRADAGHEVAGVGGPG